MEKISNYDKIMANLVLSREERLKNYKRDVERKDELSNRKLKRAYNNQTEINTLTAKINFASELRALYESVSEEYKKTNDERDLLKKSKLEFMLNDLEDLLSDHNFKTSRNTGIMCSVLYALTSLIGFTIGMGTKGFDSMDLHSLMFAAVSGLNAVRAHLYSQRQKDIETIEEYIDSIPELQSSYQRTKTK